MIAVTPVHGELSVSYPQPWRETNRTGVMTVLRFPYTHCAREGRWRGVMQEDEVGCGFYCNPGAVTEGYYTSFRFLRDVISGDLTTERAH